MLSIAHWNISSAVLYFNVCADVMQDCVYSVMNHQADVMGASALGLWYMQRDHPNVRSLSFLSS